MDDLFNMDATRNEPSLITGLVTRLVREQGRKSSEAEEQTSETRIMR